MYICISFYLVNMDLTSEIKLSLSLSLLLCLIVYIMFCVHYVLLVYVWNKQFDNHVGFTFPLNINSQQLINYIDQHI